VNVLVIGAGIGGLSSAIALAKAGHKVTLVEKMDRFEPVGAGIVLAPNAARALESLGVDLASRGHALSSVDIVGADGRLIQRIESQQVDGRYGPTWAMTRPALHEALVAALPRSVEVRLGTAIADIRQEEGGVEVQLDRARSFDVAVAGDGLHSRIRERVIGTVPLRYSGATCWRGLVPNPGIGTSIEAWGGAARIGVVPLRDRQLYYYLVLSAPRRAPPLTWPDGFHRAFGHFRGEVARLFDVLREAPPLHHDLEELEAPVWGVHRLLLLGDAAHGMTPNQGQGAAMAIEDALMLVRALAVGAEGALDRYRSLRHARVRRVQLDSRRVGRIAHWRNPLVRWLRDGLLRALPESAGRAQYRRVVDPGLALLSRA
jgi:2-polyprenyl-6-methoxyphenol hydroxylase-like FAD-dependent oxidoreductase